MINLFNIFQAGGTTKKKLMSNWHLWFKSSHSSKLLTDYFERTIERIKTSKYAPATKEMYHTAWVSMNNFLVSLDWIPYTWEDKLATFLACLIKEASKYINKSLTIRLPIQRVLIRILVEKKGESYLLKNQVYLAKLYWAMVMTAYYGLFRIGKIANDKIVFVLRTSKPHKVHNKPQVVKISAIEAKEITWPTDVNNFCPYKIIMN